MSAKVTASGTTVFKNVGQQSFSDSVGVSVKLTAEKTNRGITYLFTATENSINNLKSILGPQVSITKPTSTSFCTLESQLTYDLGKQSLSTALTAARKTRGKEVEIKAAWAELSGQWVLGTLMKPHRNHKLTATVNPHTGVSTATYTLDYKGWTVQPALNVKRRAPALAVSRKLPQGNGTLKATHALQDGATSLIWTRKPASVTVATKVRGSNVAPPTVSFTLNQDYTNLPSGLSGRRTAKSEFSQQADKPTDKSAKPSAPAREPPAAGEPNLAEKLKRLDETYEAEFARLGKRHPNGIESLSYKR